jgi:hypothetical protein
LRLLGIAAVVVGVLLLMAAAFVLSYAGIHAVALSAGVSPRLARLYPLIFDAMLVVACAAVLSLRGAGLPSRCFAWLSMLVLLVVAAGADTLHALGISLPHKPAAAAAAIIPWALVLIGFGLLLSMLRQARLRLAAADQDEGLVEPVGRVEVVAGIDALLGPKPSGSNGFPAWNGSPAPNGSPTREESLVPKAASAGAGVAGPVQSAADPVVDLAIDSEPGAKSEPQPEAQTQPEVEAEAEAQAEAESELEAEVHAEPEVQLGELEPDAQPEIEAEARPEPETAEPEPETARPEPAVTADTEAAAAELPELEAAEAQPEEFPEPALAGTAQFDRMQGSPVAPGA